MLVSHLSSDEVVMEVVYLYSIRERNPWEENLYEIACKELHRRGLAGEQYAEFIKWYEEEFALA